jgi:putative flavoprotein involved in K+ transport
MATSEAVAAAAPTAVSAWLTRFEEALASPARADWSQLFGEECYWRDFVAFTWNIITLEGRDAIAAMIKQQCGAIGATDFKSGDAALPMTDEAQGWFTFNTSTARCRGHVQLREGRAYVLITSMLELIGHEEMGGSLRPRPDGIEHRAEKGRRTWLHGRQESARTLGHSVQPYCLIVGGGHNGLMLAARLKRLGVPALVIDALEKPGDGWRARYDSLYLHDPVFLDHFPYLPFPDHWPLYTSKDAATEAARARDRSFGGEAHSRDSGRRALPRKAISFGRSSQRRRVCRQTLPRRRLEQFRA